MTAQETASVEVYWRPGCPFCRTLYRGLQRRGIPMTEINIWENPDAAAKVRAVADGNEVVPTVFIGSYALVNPSAEKVEAAIREHAPEIAPPVRENRGLFGFLRRSD